MIRRDAPAMAPGAQDSIAGEADPTPYRPLPSPSPHGTVQPHTAARDVENDRAVDRDVEADDGLRILEDDEHSCGHEHLSHRSPWLRAGLLGANDGLVSCASLMVGVGAVRTDHFSMIISGLSGLVAGACSMAIGEWISVYGQRDTEEADLEKERQEHSKGAKARAHELEELTQIYVERGLTYRLAREVAEELSKIDPIRAHARDELGIDMDDLSNPVQAATVSGAAFSVGGLVPLLSASLIDDYSLRLGVVIGTSTLAFAVFGALGAWLGGAPMWKASARGTCGGALAMLITYVVLRVFGTTL